MKIKNKKTLIFILFLFLNLIPQLFVLIAQPDNLLNWFSSDDAFYYFKTAQNISEGKGITFDGISPTNGFHPLWMIICVPIFYLARFNLYLPLRVLVAVQIVLNTISGYLLFRLVSEKTSAAAAWVVAIFWMFYPLIHETTTKMGLETGLNACMFFGFLYYVSKISHDAGENKNNRRYFWAGLIGTGLLFSRLDNIFLLILAGVWMIFKGKRFNAIAQIDFLLILASAVSSFFLRLQGTENMFEYVSFLYLLIALSLVIKPVMLYLFNCYSPGQNEALFKSFLKMAAALAISTVVIFAILYLSNRFLHLLYGFPRSAVIIDFGISSLLIIGHHSVQKMFGLWKMGGSEDISLNTNWRTWMQRGLYFFPPIFLSLSAYLLINRKYAGTAMPVSGQIKRWWGTLPNTVYGRPIATLSVLFNSLLDPSKERGPFWLILRPLSGAALYLRRLFGITKSNNLVMYHSFNVILVLLLAVLIFLAIRRFKEDLKIFCKELALLPFFIGIMFHAVIYKATGYIHVRSWYWTGESILITLLLALVLALILNWVEEKLPGKKTLAVFVLFACTVIWGSFSISIINQFPIDGNVSKEYNIQGEVQLFDRLTEPNDVIGMTGGGLTAYFIPDRTIVNLDGLINSAEYFKMMKDGEISRYLIDNKVQYIYGDALVLLDSDPYRWAFEDSLTLIEEGPYFYFYAYQPLPGENAE